MSYRVLTIIPARAGSKGHQGKNNRQVGGKPLLVRAVELAQSSQGAGEEWQIVVSTDSPRYANLAREAGALVPGLRPKSLATDTARLTEVIAHTLNGQEDPTRPFDAVLMLSPTTPLTQAQDVRKALKLFREAGGPSLISVVEERIPNTWRFTLQEGVLEQVQGGVIQPRQKTAPQYRLNGAIYVASPQWLRQRGQFFHHGESIPLIMPASRSLDIESPDDLKWVRILINDKNSLNEAPC